MTRIQHRRGTATQWATANPVLAAGEFGFETDTGIIKVGDGVNAWTALDSFLPMDQLETIFEPIGGGGSAFTGNADDLSDGVTKVVMTKAERDKLATVADSATANRSDAELLDLGGHTGQLTAAAISDFNAAVTLSLSDPLVAEALQQVFGEYLTANDYYPSLYVSEGSELPVTAAEGASVDVITGEVAAQLDSESVFSQAVAATGTIVATTNPVAALGANTAAVAFISTYLGGASNINLAPLPTAFQAMGLVWTRVTLPVEHTTNGGDSLAVYIGTGTGTTQQPQVTYASTPTNVHVKILHIINGSGTLVQSARSAVFTAGTATPSLSLTTAPSVGTLSLSAIVQNNRLNDQQPVTPYSELGAPLDSTGIRTSVAVAKPGQQSVSWNTPISPSGYQKIVAILEVS